MAIDRLLHLHELVPGPRFDLAIEQLREGLGFVFNDVWFRREATTLNVEALAPGADVTEEAAAALIDHAQATFAGARAASPVFDRTVAGMTTSFAVVDDHGMGTTVVCRLIGGQLVWERS